MKYSLLCFVRRLLLVALCVSPLARLSATDFILTIGGGYRPESNQASLEANVLFFEQVLQAEHQGRYLQEIFFANGNDPEPDLQVLAEPADHEDIAGIHGPVTQLLRDLYGSRSNDDAVEYRKHQVENVTGPNRPANIRDTLRRMCDQMTEGDRLLVYVTAHGDESKGRNRYNTSISCWDGESITAREFEAWLEDVPSEVPVILVMAQCYCGGFAHTIFRNAHSDDGLSGRLRVGFFAQQHDLPAAGCRPDIENDEEYSSFFWGAFVQRSRNGTLLPSADFDGDGRTSFAEAHAQAMLTCQTIDIPLRSSEALLRVYSRIGGGYDHRRDRDVPARNADQSPPSTPAASDEAIADGTANQPDDFEVGAASQPTDSLPADKATADVWLENNPMASMTGALRQLIEDAEPALQHTVSGLAQQLEIKLDEEVPDVFLKFERQRDTSRELRRSNSRNRRRGGSGRRQLRAEIAQQWPQLTADNWKTSKFLKQANQQELLQKIAQLPNYERFTNGLQQRQKTQQGIEIAELREVKFQRLINTLEAIVLARNLGQLADAEVVARYQAMVALEQTGLSDY